MSDIKLADACLICAYWDSETQECQSRYEITRPAWVCPQFTRSAVREADEREKTMKLLEGNKP
jgi:hypothetical protein